ncbi:FAD:protein FMN transferase [Treponema sp. TIM-1]|uniref:FAD:protein FMN transferase n=1 Tax=Treponema sp. TIM-1 TaxID=2898417 RepID=UPI00397EDAC8
MLRLSRPLFLLLGVVLTSCGKMLPARSEFVLGTICTVNLYREGTAPLYADIFARLREIEGLMSSNAADTEVARINQNAGIAPVKVGGELITVLSAALRYAELSGGAFDPTVGPLVKLWGIGTEHARLPAAEEIRGALALVNWREVIINQEALTVFLPTAGMGLDLGAIAKGYAADEAAALVRRAGISRALIDLGGNIYALGSKATGTPWRIAIQDPLDARGAYLGILELDGKSVVTSGVYERFFEAAGRRYHHILSTADGYPADTGLLSVTVIADTSIDADALSTALFALGYDKGRILVDSLENIDALFVFQDRSIRGTPGALEHFTLTNDQYRLLQ